MIPLSSLLAEQPGLSRLTPKLRAALTQLGSERVSDKDKGMPKGTSVPLGEIGTQGWNVLDGSLPLPLMVIRRSDVRHNVKTFQEYCDHHGAWLAPHSKTTMAPQLIAMQLMAGAWGTTVACVAQLQVCRAFGLQRILVANELVTDYDLGYVAGEIRDDPDLELYVLVDSVRVIERLTAKLREVGTGRPLPVFVELGIPGGRTGARQLSDLKELASAVRHSAPYLHLAGVEGYEGILNTEASGPTSADRVVRIDRYLQQLAEAVRELSHESDERLLVSAGGSMFFDRVVSLLGREALPEAQLILRSGGYVTHDSEFFDTSSPLGSRGPRRVAGKHLRPALETWSAVISRPENELCLLGMGRRDLPTDAGPPTPLYWTRPGQKPQPLDTGYQIFETNDQHAFLRVPKDSPLAVGDLVGCGISHPCAAFDRWRTILVIDDDRNVVDAIRTFF
jgi:D-serine dehydratase